jgi:hypothetical protein
MGEWKVGQVRSTTMGYGFGIVTEIGRPVASFSYKTEAEAKKAATAIQEAINDAVEGLGYP